MSHHKSDFEQRGVRVVVVSFAEPAKLALYQDRHQWPFTILADPERIAYESFALPLLPWHQVFSPSTLKLYVSLMFRGMRQERYGGADIHQSGGDFLLDYTGKILCAHRSKNPADRVPVPVLLKEIDRIRAGCG